MREEKRKRILEKEAMKQQENDLKEVEIMKSQEKYAGKSDEELLTILRQERDEAVRKIQTGFKNRSKVKEER